MGVPLNHHLPTDLASLVTAQSHNVLNCTVIVLQMENSAAIAIVSIALTIWIMKKRGARPLRLVWREILKLFTLKLEKEGVILTDGITKVAIVSVQDASRTTVNVMRPRFYVQIFVNAQDVKILRKVLRGKLSCT